MDVLTKAEQARPKSCLFQENCELLFYWQGAFAQSLRKNMTKEERHLWYDFLKQLPVTVHRQKVIGTYIVDFYCHQAKLVIEIDGSQHYEEAGQNNDRRRDEFLRGLGLSVLRFSNHEIHQNFEGVCSSILQRLEPFGQEQTKTALPCGGAAFLRFSPFYGTVLLVRCGQRREAYVRN